MKPRQKEIEKFKEIPSEFLKIKVPEYDQGEFDPLEQALESEDLFKTE